MVSQGDNVSIRASFYCLINTYTTLQPCLAPEGELVESNIFIPANSRGPVQLPYWITNSTVYQNAAIFPFAPDVLAAYRVRGFHLHRSKITIESWNNVRLGEQKRIQHIILLTDL
ncbi:hypothetical protein [Legionella cardiaca]|uniref:Uncharacterized protein n=1 Tax=Legionella cardiaca TaxID=1071983 RepID=A0ABY8AS80_9GAMM|nr:hypothetical protein [Legionella cardiaca]WED43535.1 hypothetical protein PXX05_01815 [Legionella cardiaca]